MLNEVILLGRICQAPVMKTCKDNKTRCCFSVALNSKTRDGKELVEYVSCMAKENISSFIDRYFKLGDTIAVHGSLHMSRYTTAHGDRATSTTVIVDRASFAGGAYENKEKAQENAAADAANADEVAIVNLLNEDDLPF